VGRQEFQKGHRVLLEAMAEVASARPSAVLLLAGREGAETEHLHGLAGRARLDGVVRFLGHRDDLPDVLAASDVFVFPSLWEGLGCAVIEAMALGLPIVASDIEPVREVVEGDRCAELVPPRDAARLAAAVISLLADRPRAQTLGRRGRETFLRRFTLEQITARMVELFRRVAERADPRARAADVEVA
jgi:glycosyltransferase involved in cell wall biosynthesis